MAASHRKGLRKRQQQPGYQAIIWTGSIAALIFVVCLCTFNFESNGDTHPRLQTCRSTCNARLQSAALESRYTPSSLTPSTMDSLSQRQGINSRHSTSFQGRVVDPSKASATQQQQQQARPRRLPTLIKILTGFGDNEPSSSSGYNDKKSIIARIEKPDFLPQAPPRQRNSNANNEPLSHEDTIQMTAAAAAAAVFSKSIRIFGNNRMHRVNSDWDAALRWIAGWDIQQQQHHQQQQPKQPPIRANEDGSNKGGASSLNGDTSREGFDSFVDDLARMLESCIRECVDDEHFEHRLEKDEAGQSIMAVGSSLVLRSLFGWVVGVSFPKLSFGKLDMISPETSFIAARTFQLIASSVAVYALHSLWAWASLAITHWYSSLGYSESPEWLLEHEKEIQLARTASSRKKKKKKKNSSRQPFGRTKSAQSNDRAQKDSLGEGTSTEGISEPVESAPKSRKSRGISIASDGEQWHQTRASNKGLHPTTEATATTCKDSVSGSQGSSALEGIPSVISYQLTSASSSPSMKPIGSHLEDRDMSYGSGLQGRPQPMFRLNSSFGQNSPLFPPLSHHQKPLPVPTQEQRDEAAKQLLVFQNAQIERLLLQRKLSQLNGGCVTTTVPQDSRLATPQTSRLITTQNSALTHGSSFRSAGSDPFGSGQRSNVLRPPPGLSLPSESPCKADEQLPIETTYNPDQQCKSDQFPSQAPYNPDQQIQDDKSFLADNELLISKLLDDDDEEDDVEVPSFLDDRIETMSPELSLDPSATPFISSAQIVSAPSTQMPKIEMDDVWQSGPSELSKESSPMRIKGVYGGSVW